MQRRHRRIAVVTAVLGLSVLISQADPSDAAPGCTASGLTAALSTVAGGTSAFLASHPDAEAAVDTANESTIRAYFAAHTDQWQQLQGIAAPLKNLRTGCPQQVGAGDVARLFDAMSG